MLYLFAYLGKGLFVFGDDKNGVIAKTAATLHLETDYAVTFSLPSGPTRPSLSAILTAQT